MGGKGSVLIHFSLRMGLHMQFVGNLMTERPLGRRMTHCIHNTFLGRAVIMSKRYGKQACSARPEVLNWGSQWGDFAPQRAFGNDMHGCHNCWWEGLGEWYWPLEPTMLLHSLQRQDTSLLPQQRTRQPQMSTAPTLRRTLLH